MTRYHKVFQNLQDNENHLLSDMVSIFEFIDNKRSSCSGWTYDKQIQQFSQASLAIPEGVQSASQQL